MSFLALYDVGSGQMKLSFHDTANPQMAVDLINVGICDVALYHAGSQRRTYERGI